MLKNKLGHEMELLLLRIRSMFQMLESLILLLLFFSKKLLDWLVNLP
uniref:Uncharacterized protein n=1 Tax=Rhizophora mucronata TaxID=61149 RepID=A0A2P2N304_RHIMU